MRKKCAALTMVYNASVFLPIWLRYYSQFLRADDIYVLDHESTDGCTHRSGFVRIPVFHPVIDSNWFRDIVQEYQHELLRKYEIVLCTDVDEIVAPHPSTGTFQDYIDKFNADFVNCNGYEVLHLKDKEAPIDLSRPVLEQRGYWYHSPRYFSKPLMTRVPMDWTAGFHSRRDGKTRDDADLYLIHLHRMDYDMNLVRNQERLNVRWSESDLKEGLGIHNRYTGDQFQAWFYGDSQALEKVEPIPECWKSLKL